ncbi:hypothetical protein IM043_gp093 [Bacillus phage SPG24]|nr:hypothetical protein IM043_gp093 [Bacillus phage SPG24]
MSHLTPPLSFLRILCNTLVILLYGHMRNPMSVHNKKTRG